MVRFVDIRVSTRLAVAAAVFTVAKENTFRFLACYVHNVVCRPHLSQEKNHEWSRLSVLRVSRKYLMYIVVAVLLCVLFR